MDETFRRRSYLLSQANSRPIERKYIYYIVITLVCYLIVGGLTFWVVEQPYQSQQCKISQSNLDDKITEYANVIMLEGEESTRSEDSNDSDGEFIGPKMKKVHDRHGEKSNLGGSENDRSDSEDTEPAKPTISPNSLAKFSLKDVKNMLSKFTHEASKDLAHHYHNDCHEQDKDYVNWSFYQSLFYSFTVITTIQGCRGKVERIFVKVDVIIDRSVATG